MTRATARLVGTHLGSAREIGICEISGRENLGEELRADRDLLIERDELLVERVAQREPA
jgi:hypothetical protein